MEELDEDLLSLAKENDMKNEKIREKEDNKRWENYNPINNSDNLNNFTNNSNGDSSANMDGIDTNNKALNNFKQTPDINEDTNVVTNNENKIDAQNKNINPEVESDNLDAFDSVMREINHQKSAEINHEKSTKEQSPHPDESMDRDDKMKDEKMDNDDTEEDPQKSISIEQKHSDDENDSEDDNSVDPFDGSVVDSNGDANNAMDTDDNTSHSMVEIPMDSNDDNTNSSSIHEASSFTLKEFLEGYSDEHFNTDNDNEVVTDVIKDIFNLASQEYFEIITNKCEVGRKHTSQLLGKCSENKMKMRSLTEMKKMYPDFCGVDNARTTLEENQLILNRLGVPFSSPNPDYENLTICCHHSSELLQHFAVENVCQTCGCQVGKLPKRATLRQAKHFQDFPDVLVKNSSGIQKFIRIGLPLCDNCVGSIDDFIRDGNTPYTQKSSPQTKMNNRSSIPMVTIFDSEVTSESPDFAQFHPRNDSGLMKYMWYSIDPENPSIPTESQDPPDKVVSLCETEDSTETIDMQFALELNMTMKSQKEYQTGYVETLRKLFTGLTTRPVILQPFEFFHHTNICYRLFDFLVIKLSENINYREKIIQFFSIPFYKLIFIPNKEAIKSACTKKERLIIIFADSDDKEVTICLTCPDLSCTGCGEEKKTKIMEDLGSSRHVTWLGRCCRICGTTDFKNVHYHGTIPKPSEDVKEEAKKESISDFKEDKSEIKKDENGTGEDLKNLNKDEEPSDGEDNDCDIKKSKDHLNGVMDHSGDSVKQKEEFVKTDTNGVTSPNTMLNGETGLKDTDQSMETGLKDNDQSMETGLKDTDQSMEEGKDSLSGIDIKLKWQCPNLVGKVQEKGIHCKFNHTEEIKHFFGVDVTMDDPQINPSRLCNNCYNQVIEPVDDLKNAEDAKLKKLLIKTFVPHNSINCLDGCGYYGLENWARVNVGEIRRKVKKEEKVEIGIDGEGTSEKVTGLDKEKISSNEEVTGVGEESTKSAEGVIGSEEVTEPFEEIKEGVVESGEDVSGPAEKMEKDIEGVIESGESVKEAAGINEKVIDKVNGLDNGLAEPIKGVNCSKEPVIKLIEEVTGFALMLSYECIPTLKILATGLKLENPSIIRKTDFKLTVKNAVEISLTLAKTKDSELYGKLVRRGIIQGPDRTTFVLKAHDFRTLLDKFSANFYEAVKKDKLSRSSWERKLKEVLHMPYYSSEVVIKKGSDSKKFYYILKVRDNKLICITCTLDECKCEIPQATLPDKKGGKEGGGRKYVGKLQSMSRKLGLNRTMTNAEYVHLMDTGVWKEAKEIPSRKRSSRNVEKPGKFVSDCEICHIRFVHEKVFLFHLQSCNYSNNGKICCPTCRRTYDSELGIIKHLQFSEFCGSVRTSLGIKSGRHNSTDSSQGSLASSSDIPDLASIKPEDADEDDWDNISVICEVEDDEDDDWNSGMFKLMMRMEEDVWVTVDELLMEGGVGWRSEVDEMDGGKTVLLHSPNEDSSVTYQNLDTEDMGGKLVVVKGPGVLEFCSSGWSGISSSMPCVVYDKRRVRMPQLPMETREPEQDTESPDEDGQFSFQRPNIEICVGCQAEFSNQQDYKAHTRICESMCPWACYGCGLRFEHETPMLKHISKCKFCSLPEDLRNPIRTQDGKIGCLGCRKTWKDIGQCYYKHVTSGCKRVKPGKFPCKKCKSKFSTNNSLEIHMDECRGHKTINIETGPASRKNKNSRNTRNERVQPLPRKKRPISSEDSDSDTPLSKRSRTTYIVKTEIQVQETTEYHEPVCKIGAYKCPICGTRFRLNQPYGRHVQSLSCSKARLDKEIPEYNKMLFVTIHRDNHAGPDESTIAYSQVPSLQMLSRGFFTESGFPPEIELPSPTIKEAIEMNYSIKHSDDYKELDREERWRYFHHRKMFRMVATSKDMISSCISILKIVNLFENKIRLARTSEGKDSELARNWNEKLSQYLKIDYHDNINTSNIVNNFRVIEYAKDGKLACLCLLCPSLNCIGCFIRKTNVKIKKKVPQQSKKQPNQYTMDKKKAGRQFYGNQFTNTKGKSSPKPSAKTEVRRKPEPHKKQPNQYSKVKKPARVASPAIDEMTPKQLYQARYRLKQRLNKTAIPTENEYYYHSHTGKFITEAVLEKQHAELSKKLGNRQLTFQEFLEYKFQPKTEPLYYDPDEYESPPEDPEDDEYTPQTSKEKRRPSRDSLTNNSSHKQKNTPKAKAGPKSSKTDSTKCFYCQYCESAFQTQTILQRHEQSCQNNPQNFEPENVYMEEDNYYEEEEPVQEEMDSLCTVESYCSLQDDTDSNMPLVISPSSMQEQVVDGSDPLDGLNMDQDPLGDCILPD